MRHWLAGLLVLWPGFVWAAACCGSNALFPALISSDEKRQFTLSALYADTLAMAPAQGAWQRLGAGESESRVTMRLDAATLLSDRWQLGASLPLVRRAREGVAGQGQAWGLGDASVQVAYEFLPVWTYSPWKPKGLAFLALGVPLGRAPFEAQLPFQLDVTGRGFWSVSAGALLSKNWGPWDVHALTEVHWGMPRSMDAVTPGLVLSPGFGVSVAAGAGYSWSALRLGLQSLLAVDAGVASSGALNADAPGTRSLALSAQVAYLVSDQMSVSLVATHNGLVGVSSNLPIVRSLSAVMQVREPR